MNNEIKVRYFELPKIQWNYEELKNGLISQLEKYRAMAYTEENIKDAKKDRADLNKLYKAINDKKIEVKKDYTAELNVFEGQVKELLHIVDTAKTTCENAIADYEEKRKNERMDRIRAIYEENKGELGKYISLQTMFNEKWLNASVSEKEIENDIKATFINAGESIKIIERLNSPYELEGKRKFYESLSLTQALEVIDTLTRLSEIEREADEALANEAMEDFPYSMNLKVTATGAQWAKLGAFCKANGIEVEYV